MITLLHLPLLLVPGLAFLAIALGLRAPVPRGRLALGAVLVAVGVLLAQYGLSKSYSALGIHGGSVAMLVELVGDALVQFLGFWLIAKLRPVRAILAALFAAGLDLLLSAIWAAGLGGRRPPAA